jgi:hypothetical protein
MIRTIFSSVGPIGVSVTERHGRWRASLLGGAPNFGAVGSAIDRSADEAFANLAATVEATLAAAQAVNEETDQVSAPGDS